MTAHSRPGAQNIDARVTVGQVDELPHVNAHPLADEGELVGEGDVDVPEGVFRQLGHLRGSDVGEHQVAHTESAVQALCHLRCPRGQTTDDPGVGHHLHHDPSGQHTLWTVCEVHRGPPTAAIQRQVRTPREDRHGHVFGGPGRRGGLQDDERITCKPRGDLLRRRLDVGQVRLVVITCEGCRYGNDIDVRPRGLGLGA